MQTNCLNLLIVLLLGLIPCKMHATDSEKGVMLYTPYTKISVPPGESIDYSIDVINKSDEVKNAKISIEGSLVDGTMRSSPEALPSVSYRFFRMRKRISL